MADVVLQQAWQWSCPDCFRLHFVSPVPVELTPEQWSSMVRARCNLEPWEEVPEEFEHAGFRQVPTRVVCSECGRHHAVAGMEA